MIQERFLWRIREKDVRPAKVRCSTEKFVGDHQPFLDQDGELVTEGLHYFLEEEKAWAALLSMRKIALDQAQTDLGIARAEAVVCEKLVEDLAKAYDLSLTAYEAK